MNYPGEYPEGLLRTTNIKVLVATGYTTARLQVQGEPTNSGSGLNASATFVSMKNVSTQTVGLQLQGTDDYTSGPWEWVGAAQSLVPSGGTNYTVNPRHKYLEVVGQSGQGHVEIQLSSRLRWDELGFAKTDATFPQHFNTARNPLTFAV
jgi:hypothetical protein